MIPESDLVLLLKYLERSLSPEEEAQLTERFKKEPLLCEHLILLAREEAMLREWAQATQEAERLAVLRMAPSFTGPSSRRSPVLRSRKWSATILAAAVVLLCLGFFLFQGWGTFGLKPLPPSVARAKESIGEVAIIAPNGIKRPLRAGESIPGGHKIETGAEGSFAVLELFGSGRLEVGESTLLELSESGKSHSGQARQVSVHRGFVRAKVNRSDPMILSSSHAQIEASETVCNFWSEPEATRVELEEGEAELTRRTDGKTALMQEGSYIVAAPVVPQLIPRPLPKAVHQSSAILFHGGGPLLALAISPNGNHVATGGWQGTVKIWDRLSGKLIRSFAAHDGKKKKIHGIAYSPNGRLLATCGHDRRVRLWNAETTDLVRDLPPMRHHDVKALEFSPDGQYLATLGGMEKRAAILQLWTVQGNPVHRFQGREKRFSALAFSPDGRMLAAGDLNGYLHVWDVETKARITQAREHKEAIRALAWSPDGRALVSGSRDHRVKVWDARTFDKPREIEGHFRVIQSLSFSPDGNLLAIATDGRVKLWEMAHQREIATIRADSHQVCAVRFTPDGVDLVTCGWKRKAHIWNLEEMFCGR